MIGGINVLAVLVATIISMALGFIWYSNAVFGRRWLAAGRTQMGDSASPMLYVVTIAFALLQATILAVVITLTGATTAVAGAMLGLLAWVGFVATTKGVDGLFVGSTFAYYTITAGYHLVEYVLIGALLGAWR